MTASRRVEDNDAPIGIGSDSQTQRRFMRVSVSNSSFYADYQNMLAETRLALRMENRRSIEIDTSEETAARTQGTMQWRQIVEGK